MSSTQANKAHKQEGTLASKMHKQGALNTSVLPRILNPRGVLVYTITNFTYTDLAFMLYIWGINI